MTMKWQQFEIERVDDAERWNAEILCLPYSHVLQSHQWGAFKSRHGWVATRLLFCERGRTRAAASILTRQAPRLPVKIMYVPKGPALDYAEPTLVESVLSFLESWARQHHALLIKIDPDVSLDDDDPRYMSTLGAKVTGQVCPLPASANVLRVLGRRGWRYSREQIQFKNTILIDVTLSEETLLANMKPKTRYNVRLAAKKGVIVRRGDLDDLETFYHMYAETSERDHFLIRTYEYYRDAWQTFLRAGLAEFLLAEHEGRPLAGLMLFIFGQKALYMYGASANEGRNLMPNYLLQWEALRACRARGCELYDLWGAPDELLETDRMWGVYRFKEGLGGQFVRHIGAYDFPANRPLYFVYQVLLPRYLSLLRKRRTAVEMTG